MLRITEPRVRAVWGPAVVKSQKVPLARKPLIAICATDPLRSRWTVGLICRCIPVKKKNLIYAYFVAKCSPQGRVLGFIPDYIPEKICSNVPNAPGHLRARECCESMSRPTPVSDCLNARTVRPPLRGPRCWRSTCEFTPVRSHSSAPNVSWRLPGRRICELIWGLIAARSRTAALDAVHRMRIITVWRSTLEITIEKSSTCL
jgi:hypothetical protein